MFDDRRKTTAAILGAGAAPEEESAGDAQGLEAAMEELGGALAAKDWKGAAEAFRNATEIAKDGPPSEEPPEMDDD